MLAKDSMIAADKVLDRPGEEYFSLLNAWLNTKDKELKALEDVGQDKKSSIQNKR